MSLMCDSPKLCIAFLQMVVFNINQSDMLLLLFRDQSHKELNFNYITC